MCISYQCTELLEPLNILCTKDELYPAKLPQKTNRRMNAVVNEPLFAGDSNPSKANESVAMLIIKSCIPVPTKILSNMGWLEGGLKTSPCTSFHPNSSFCSMCAT